MTKRVITDSIDSARLCIGWPKPLREGLDHVFPGNPAGNDLCLRIAGRKHQHGCQVLVGLDSHEMHHGLAEVLLVPGKLAAVVKVVDQRMFLKRNLRSEITHQQ